MYTRSLKPTSAKQDKGEMIINAAMELYREKGYINTRIIDIANRAEIGKGTVYAYFKSKEDILLKIINNIVEQDYNTSYNIVPREASVAEKLTGYLEIFEKMLDQYGVYAMILKEQIFNKAFEDSEELKRVITRLHDLQYEEIRKIIQEGMDSGELRNINAHNTALYVMNAIGYYMLTEAFGAKHCSETICDDMLLFSAEKNTGEGSMNKAELINTILYGIAAQTGGEERK